uniref:Lymphocyte antigen 6E-like n=1 Tax=Geotrypetes seraphini TaxID=260995 RepID=A0A6P8QU99_GEOSA|nr:lymphocyte antigen 6E-like [Geotrypetes seraphini]
MKMKTFLVSLLIAAFCTWTAYSLTCYTCLIQPTNKECMIETRCTDMDTYCVTAIQYAGAGTTKVVSITKLCSPICSTYNISLAVAGNFIYCCETDRCNVNRAARAEISDRALAISVGFIYSALRGGC